MMAITINSSINVKQRFFFMGPPSGDVASFLNFQIGANHIGDFFAAGIDVILSGEQLADSGADHVEQVHRFQMVGGVHLRRFGDEKDVARVVEVDAPARRRLQDRNPVFPIGQPVLERLPEQELEQSLRQFEIDAFPADAECVGRLHVEVSAARNEGQLHCGPVAQPGGDDVGHELARAERTHRRFSGQKILFVVLQAVELRPPQLMAQRAEQMQPTAGFRRIDAHFIPLPVPVDQAAAGAHHQIQVFGDHRVPVEDPVRRDAFLQAADGFEEIVPAPAGKGQRRSRFAEQFRVVENHPRRVDDRDGQKPAADTESVERLHEKRRPVRETFLKQSAQVQIFVAVGLDVAGVLQFKDPLHIVSDPKFGDFPVDQCVELPHSGVDRAEDVHGALQQPLLPLELHEGSAAGDCLENPFGGELVDDSLHDRERTAGFRNEFAGAGKFFARAPAAGGDPVENMIAQKNVPFFHGSDLSCFVLRY